MKTTAILHDCSLDGETGYAATCIEFPEANGQGESVDECISNLKAAIDDILSFRREIAEKELRPGERIETLMAS